MGRADSLAIGDGQRPANGLEGRKWEARRDDEEVRKSASRDGVSLQPVGDRASEFDERTRMDQDRSQSGRLRASSPEVKTSGEAGSVERGRLVVRPTVNTIWRFPEQGDAAARHRKTVHHFNRSGTGSQRPTARVLVRRQQTGWQSGRLPTFSSAGRITRN